MIKWQHDKIVILIAAFNEGRYIREALEALRRQSYSNFSVVISDNNSVDNTYEIAKEYSQKDSRFFCYKQNENIGSIANAKFLFENSGSEYVMFLGAHDYIADDYIEKQCRALDSVRERVLAYSRTTWISEDGRIIRESSGGEFVFISSTAVERYISAARGPWGECTAVCGVFRRSALSGMKFYQFAGPDHYILVRVQRFGLVYRTEEPIYYRRDFVQKEVGYMERITGVAKNAYLDKRNMYPLVTAVCIDFLSCDFSIRVKLSSFPRLLFALCRGNGLIYPVVLKYIPHTIKAVVKEALRRGAL